MKELKPCPFCGCTAEYTMTGLADAYSDYEIIACTKCPAQMPKENIEAWNTRNDGWEPKDQYTLEELVIMYGQDMFSKDTVFGLLPTPQKGDE